METREGILFIFFVSIGVLFFTSFSVAADSIPSANIPFAPSPVSIDGHWAPAEWSAAAVVRGIRDMGNVNFAEPRTEFYLQYDADALYVAAVCHERQKGYPRAAVRDPRDTLITNDDAVQVVLGVADANIPAREVLTMGGYQGALGGATTAADHYYQFTINAAGSIARTYNETPLKRPGFTAAVGRTDSAWVAEMRIPFAACGLVVRPGQTLYANLFRFRPPVMTAWHLPAFGGYSAMPLGTFTFLPKDRVLARTCEPMPAERPPAVDAQSPRWTGRIGYYPLSGSVVATVEQTVFAPGTQAKFTVSGLGTKAVTLSGEKKQWLVFELPKQTQPTRRAELTILDANGKVLERIRRDLPAAAIPEWVGTKAGQDYVDKKIPRPWTRPVVRGREVQLVDKTLTVGPLGLFSSVRDRLGELVAGDPQIVVETKNARPMIFTPSALGINPNGLGVEAQARGESGTARLETRSLVDYDGFTIVKLRLLGITPGQISRLAVRIPLKPEHAKFIHKVLAQEIGQLEGHGYEMSAGPLWVGDYDKGLAFTFDTDPFLSRDLRRQVRVVEAKDAAWMEFNFVDAPGQVKDAGHIFRFFLQPTPTKPVTLEKIHPRVQWQWEGWSDYQGYPDLAKMDSLKKWSADLHAKGEIGLLYTCQGLAENAPGFAQYKEDVMAQPEWIFYRRAFDPGRGVPCYHCCKRGPEGDLQLWAFDKLSREAGIDGTVSDGLSLAWPCENPGHAHGCGRPAPVEWDRDGLTRVTGQREFLKRIRGIFNDTGRPFFMTAHCGGGLEINTLSLFDGYMEGEQLCRFRTGYQIPTATIAVGYSGRPWGFRTIFWEKTWRRTRGFFWSLTYAMLHDLELEDSPIANEIYAPFQNDNETTYYPYWRPQPHVALRSDHSRVSYYLKADRALVVAGNLEFEPDHVELDLSKLFPGQTLTVRELLSGQPVAVQNNIVKSPLAGYRCLVLSVIPGNVSTRQEAAKPAARIDTISIKGFHKNDWSVNTDAPGVKAEYPSSGGLTLKSTPYQSAAVARLKAHTLGRNGTILLKLTLTGRFMLHVGPVTLLHDYDWQMPGPLNGWNEGTVYQLPVTPGKLSLLALTVTDGVFDAVLDGRVLVRNMRFDLPANGNEISVQTWAGDSLILDVVEIATTSTRIVEPGVVHPVL